MSNSGVIKTLVFCFIAASNLGVYAIRAGGAAIEAEEVEIGEGVGGPQFGPLSHFDDGLLCREMSLRGLGGCFGAGGPGFRPGPGFPPGSNGGRRRPGLSRRGHLRPGLDGPIALGAGGAAGVGALGGVEKGGSSVGAIESDTRVRDHNGIEGAQGSLLANNKKFDVGHHNNIHSDSSGLHKHQVVDNEKLVVKENNRGVNDLDINRNSNDINTGAHLSSESGNLAAQGSRGSIENDKSFSNRNSALSGQSNEFAAGGAVGAGAIGGAGGIL